MACTSPITAWSLPGGGIQLGKREPASRGRPELLYLPCGKCQGCQTSYAQGWALRCRLELLQHRTASFTTLTYRNEALPPTLNRQEFSAYFKRLRSRLGAARPIRFFGCGEYGEKSGRPHYHAIIYGAHAEHDKHTLSAAWPHGHAYSVPVTAANINYVAGYTNKKIRAEKWRGPPGWIQCGKGWLDPDTGEYTEWQPAFRQMSRRPGIGGEARQHTMSWKDHAVMNGVRIPVPRFYHDAWKAQATPEQIEQHKYEKIIRANSKQPITYEQLEAQEKINNARQAQRAAKRNKL